MPEIRAWKCDLPEPTYYECTSVKTENREESEQEHMSCPKGSEGASEFHRVAHSMHVLGRVLKVVFPYLECAAHAIHSGLLCINHTEPAD